jgi:hypothetical protein
MKTVIFLSIIKRIVGVTGIILLCSLPAHAGKPKTPDKPKPPANLILTLPDQWLADEKTNKPISMNVAAHNNENQAFAAKKIPVNVKCDVDVIQNTVNDVPLSNRLFGECDLHYHY